MALNMLRRPESSQEDFKAKILKDTTRVYSRHGLADCCAGDWEGIDVIPRQGRIVTLLVTSTLRQEAMPLYMKGTLSTLLGELQFLEALVTSGMKQIGGSIPETLSKLVHLTQLVL
ncbi:hypothetical protein IFM89_013045 [Coptis chinensis]|uniref:Uncharacterized protein n=1 Tax=Coptis chinensis TaxID=261450 RepID=A0A835LIH3_9MAGN|nr:hypothetical protein IFM89_013045 [Coptis chinensis]